VTGTAEVGNDVVYHGRGSGAGGRPIRIETPDGRHIGVLRHVVRHSPTGLSWGYGGSGPADTARSLLIAALGPDATCRTCGGTGRLVFDPNAGEEPSPVPWDPTKPPEEYTARGLEVTQCWDCDEGFRQLPCQAFKWAHVATWGDEFGISRTQILVCLSEHQHQLAVNALGLPLAAAVCLPQAVVARRSL
jgi:hypothetical protein